MTIKLSVIILIAVSWMVSAFLTHMALISMERTTYSETITTLFLQACALATAIAISAWLSAQF